MRNRIYLLAVLLLCNLAMKAQMGGDFNPDNPDDPEITALKHTLTLTASPKGGGSFNIQKERFAEGSSNTLNAYSNTDYTFKAWVLNGVEISTDPTFNYVMPKQDVNIIGLFEYNPTNPGNPGSNFWSKESGTVIVDDFTPGNLSNAISTAINGSNRSDVTEIIVYGRMNGNDFGIANNYSNCSSLDLSRVTGVTEIPSYAFDYTNLAAVSLPNTIENIGTWAFGECKDLQSLTCYAMTPPALGNNVFQGVPEGLVVYVPAAAIALYEDAEGWKDFMLLPLKEDISNLSVSLPSGANATDYTNMWLELINKKNDQRIHYVMTDRNVYTFNNIIHNTLWEVVVRNQNGDVFGRIEKVEMKDTELNIAFTSLSKPQNVGLTVKDSKGQDVTSQTQVTWTDEFGNYLSQATSLNALPVGKNVCYRIVLSQDLAMQYDAPEKVDYTVKNGGNNIVCQLKSIGQLTLTGTVKDAATGMALSGAVVSASQTFGGKYSKTINAKTDSKGQYSLTVANVPTSISVASSDYISQTIDCEQCMSGAATVALPEVSLKAISGATITLGFTYTTVDGETQNWFSDYQNVDYALYNESKGKTINQYNVQYPQIVLLEDVDDGDVLRLTASSRTNAFMPVTTSATIAEQKAEATFAVVELGKIEASIGKNSNASVVGTLYDASGKLVKTDNYSGSSLTISNLTDGTYTLVTMGSSQFFNTIYDLSQLPQTGLREGTDYVKNLLDVKSGTIRSVSIDEVPTFDESKLYITGDNTSFMVNKPSIVVGNYLTLTSRIEIKPEYSDKVRNVLLVVDLPASCYFVENSVMVGNSTGIYTQNGQQIIIPITQFTDRVRFCIIPTLEGDYAPSAFVQFDLNGEAINQPIGNAKFTADGLSILSASTVNKTNIPISGTAVGKCDISIYDNGVLIGKTKSMANGYWVSNCELNNAYNLSRHNINAKITTSQGIELQTEMTTITYDKNSAQVVKVTQYNEQRGPTPYLMTFDFMNPSTTSQHYSYDMYDNNRTFTYTIEFTNNKVVDNVTLYVKTNMGHWWPLKAAYDEKKDLWVAESEFGDSQNRDLPVNVSVDYEIGTVVYIDRSLFNDIEYRIDNQEQYVNGIVNEINEANSDNALINDSLVVQSDLYQTLISSDDNEYSTLVSYLTSIGIDVSENLRPETPSMSEKEKERYIDDILNRTESYLSDNLSAFDESEYFESTIQSNHLMNQIDSLIDIDASLQLSKTDTIYYEQDGVSWCYFEIPLSQISLDSYDSSLLVYDKLDDKTQFVSYADDNIVFIIDSLQQSVRVFEREKGSVNHKSSISLKSASGSSGIESLRRIVVEFPNNIQRATDALKIWIATYEDKIKEIDKSIDLKRKIITKYQSEYVILGDELKKIEVDLWRIQDITVEDAYRGSELYNRKLQLEKRQKQLFDEIQKRNVRIKELTQQKNALGAKRLPLLTWVSSLSDLINGVRALNLTIQAAQKGIEDYDTWNQFVDNILPCEEDNEKAKKIYDRAVEKRNSVAIQYGVSATKALASTALSLGSLFTRPSGVGGAVVSFFIGAISDWLRESASQSLNCTYQTSVSSRMQLANERDGLKCEKKENDNNDSDKKTDVPRGHVYQGADMTFCIDPSGYVYEGVSSNRVQGATATVFYKEYTEDMYGDLHENVVKWNAEEYAQENPLFTDEHGMYRWDVPQGLWQVKYEKEGYETTYSDWLPVPPPQLEVNIPMKQSRQPEVMTARAFEDAVEVEFDKYMMPELLTADNIVVMQNSKAVEGSIQLLNEEVSYEGEQTSYASRVRFNASKPFTAKEVTLMVSNRVKSYAGIRMQEDFSQDFTVEKEIKQIVCAPETRIAYGETGSFIVNVIPADAAAGKTLRVKTSSSMITSVETETVTIDKNGQAEITVNGELPGATTITLSIDGSDCTATTMVKVEMLSQLTTATPTVNIASGSVVDKGTEIHLACATEGAVIYYTLDGSCPCDDSPMRKVYDGTPIIVNDNVTIHVMAVAPDMYESDVAEFTYIVYDATGIDEVAMNGVIDIYPLPVCDKLNPNRSLEIVIC